MAQLYTVITGGKVVSRLGVQEVDVGVSPKYLLLAGVRLSPRRVWCCLDHLVPT